MTPDTQASLVERRLAVRRELLAQRQLIALRLGDAPLRVDEPSVYPRSNTMRVLTAHPQLIGTLLAGVSILLPGAGFLRSVSAGLALAAIVRSATSSTRRSAPIVP